MSDNPQADPPSASSAGATIDRRWLRTDNVLLAALLGVLVWFTGDVLLLIFAGLLLAVGLDGLAGALKHWTPLSRGWALAVAMVLAVAFFAIIGMTVVPQFLGELDELWQRLIDFADRVYQVVSRYGWAQELAGEQEGQLADALTGIAQQAALAVLAVVGVLGSLIIILAIAVFAAVNPPIYRHGALSLFPAARRARIEEALSVAGYALRWWFLGQIVSMLALGVTVGVGLMIIGIDLWLSLAVLTALLTFIPFLGPIIAGIPIVIIGFAEGLEIGFIVLVFYLVVQNLEGNFLMPMIQHRAVNLAPALLISVQVLMGTVFGAMGLILAAPVTVVAMVFVKKLYVEDVVGEPQTSP